MLKFAENLYNYRKSISVTQSAFADILNDKLREMGLSIDYNNKSISMWEKGARFPDSPLVWIALADIMNVSLDVMMKSDIFDSEATVTIAKPQKSNLQDELLGSRMNQLCSGAYSSFNTSYVYSNVDEYLGENLYHGMFYVLSTSKSNNGYFQKYNIEGLDATSKYIKNVSKTNFCNETSFVRDIILNGGKEGVVTNDRISRVWEEFFDCLGNVEEYDTMTFFDEDKNHVLTMVEYHINITKNSFAQTLNLSGNIEAEINNIIVKNKKFHLGVRLAKEFIK